MSESNSEEAPPTEAKETPVKNKLSDLNNHLFAQLERLSDEDLTPEQIEVEAKRADAVVAVSDQICRGAELQLKAVKIIADHGDRARRWLVDTADAALTRNVSDKE